MIIVAGLIDESVLISADEKEHKTGNAVEADAVVEKQNATLLSTTAWKSASPNQAPQRFPTAPTASAGSTTEEEKRYW